MPAFEFYEREPGTAKNSAVLRTTIAGNRLLLAYDRLRLAALKAGFDPN